jgi:undecaprenyl-diphosphatase
VALQHTHVWQGGATWERAMLSDVHAHALPAWLDQGMFMVPLLGTNLVILPAVLIVGLWLWKRKRQPRLALQLLIVSIGSLSLNPTMKHLLDRDRPDLFPQRGMFNWASYPSGHAILTTAFYFTIALMLWRMRGWRWPFAVALALVTITCYSRIYLSVHWPTDIIGGLLIGAVWLAGTWLSFSRGEDV